MSLEYLVAQICASACHSAGSARRHVRYQAAQAALGGHTKKEGKVSGAKMKARRNVSASGLGPDGAIVKFEPNQAPLTMKSCRISGVGAHSIGRLRTSPSQTEQSGTKTLRGDSLVVLEQPAEPLTTADIAKRKRRYVADGSLLPSLRSKEELVFTPLMRPFGVIQDGNITPISLPRAGLRIRGTRGSARTWRSTEAEVTTESRRYIVDCLGMRESGSRRFRPGFWTQLSVPRR
jgi:hypothetical protein